MREKEEQTLGGVSELESLVPFCIDPDCRFTRFFSAPDDFFIFALPRHFSLSLSSDSALSIGVLSVLRTEPGSHQLTNPVQFYFVEVFFFDNSYNYI